MSNMETMTHSFEQPTFSGNEAMLRNRVALDGAEPRTANLTFQTITESGIRTDKINRLTTTDLDSHPLKFDGGLIVAPQNLGEQTPLARIKGVIREVGQAYSAFELESDDTYGSPESVAERRDFYAKAAEQADLTGIYVNADHQMLANMHESGIVSAADYVRATEMLLVEAAVTDRDSLHRAQQAQIEKLNEMELNGQLPNADIYETVTLVSTGETLEGVDRSIPVMFSGLETRAQIEAHAAKLQRKTTSADALGLAA